MTQNDALMLAATVLGPMPIIASIITSMLSDYLDYRYDRMDWIIKTHIHGPDCIDETLEEKPKLKFN